MSRLTASLLMTLALMLPAAVGQNAAPTEPRSFSTRTLYQLGLRSTCWVVQPAGSGTGWVLDRERRLIVTNEHVVRGTDIALVWFPVSENGKLVRDPQHYRDKVKPIRARVIDRDAVRDLALLQLDALPATARALRLANESSEPGDPLRAVGALPQGSEGLWGNVSGEVRNVIPRPNAGGRALMIESTLDINHGNSGGAVLNERGELAGVVKAAYFGGEVLGTSLLIDVTEVHAYLKLSLPMVAPETARQFIARGDRRLKSLRFDAATEDFNAALKLDGTLAGAHVRLGVARTRAGKPADALTHFDAALKIDPKSREALLNRGTALRLTGKLDDAVADLTKAIELSAATADGFRERGLAFSQAQRFAEAVADFTKAIALNGKDVTLFVERAVANRRQNKPALAIADYEAALRLQPENPDLTNDLGVAHLEAGDVARAKTAFLKAVEKSRRNPIFLNNVGVAKRLTGDHPGAIKAYTEALDLFPDGAPFYNAGLSYLGRALSLRALKDFSGAIRDLSKAIQLDGKVAGYWFERGLTHQANGSLAAAQEDFRKAVELNKIGFGPRVVAMNPAIGVWIR